MEVYHTEQEQLDVFRRFFQRSGKSIIVGIIVGAAIFAGWRYWTGYQAEQLNQASIEFDQKITALFAAKAEERAPIEAEIKQFIADNHNYYGVLAALQLTYYYSQNTDSKVNNLTEMESLLTSVKGYSQDQDLTSLLSIRLARVQLQQQKYDEALKVLDQVKGDSWLAKAYELRGDIALAKNDIEAARQAYNQGLQLKSTGNTTAILRMKLSNLAG